MKAKAFKREGEVIRDQIKENKQTIHEQEDLLIELKNLTQQSRVRFEKASAKWIELKLKKERIAGEQGRQ